MSSREDAALTLTAHEARKIAVALDLMISHLRSHAESTDTTTEDAVAAELDLAFYEGLVGHVRHQLDSHLARNMRPNRPTN